VSTEEVDEAVGLTIVDVDGCLEELWVVLVGASGGEPERFVTPVTTATHD
jgi:hypothetical protein